MFWLTLGLLAITTYYAFVTARMAKSAESTVNLMKEQSDSIARPYVTISLVKRPNNPYIHLRIENTGQTPAVNLTLSLGPKFETIKDLEGMKKLKGSHMFTQTIASFSPRSPVYFLLGFGATLHGDNDKQYPQETFNITAEYSYAQQNVKETTVVDINQYNATSLDKDPIVDALNKIKDEIAKK